MNQNIRRILVTSGGTSEPIDSVRKITNTSTGRLGSLVADAFLDAGVLVDYITTETAMKPHNKECAIHIIESTNELQETMKKLLSTNHYDGVIHAMAVSDYTIDYATSLQMMKKACENGVDIVDEGSREELLAMNNMGEDGKISSSLNNLVLVLRPTPKVISLIKGMQPNTLLFGFKLLVGANQNALVKEAMRVMQKNNCDYMVANDLNSISGDSHTAYLISNKGDIKTAYNKQEIAESIVKTAMLHWEENKL